MNPIVPVNVSSIYLVAGQRAPLPTRMARCATDMKHAIFRLIDAVAVKEGQFVLSDLFRSYDMQLQAHLDFTSHKKASFSPPPGGSMHEAGRAFDVDLKSLKMPLSAFWKLAATQGIVPINPKPDPAASEAWHFECRGSHQLVYDYYAAGNGSNFDSSYKAMAASAIAAVGIQVDKFADHGDAAYVQSALIRLGKVVGNLDGDIGPKTRRALVALGVTSEAIQDQITALDVLLQKKFPDEFFDKTPDPGIIQ